MTYLIPRRRCKLCHHGIWDVWPWAEETLTGPGGQGRGGGPRGGGVEALVEMPVEAGPYTAS
jgi:hypothetical protein